MEKKLAMVWDFTVAPLQLYGWADGLNDALRILAEEKGVFVKIIPSDNANEIWQQIEEFKPDAILGWGSLDRPSFAGFSQFNVPKFLCFAGGTTKHPNSVVFDKIFVENKAYQDEFKKDGIDTVLAFGTNDRLFKPKQMPIKWLGIYAASFARWKRHDVFYGAVGDKGLAVGKIIPHEIDCFDAAKTFGTTLLPEVPYYVLPYLYNQSELALIPARAGGQRNVLEAMSCNLYPIVAKDNITTAEFVLDSGWGDVVEPSAEAFKEAIKKYQRRKNKMDLRRGRQFIESKYTSKHYADVMYKTIFA